MRALVAIVLILAAVAAAHGCSGDDDPQQVVSKLRVLGVRADSPDVTYAMRSSSAPSFDPATVKLDALVADPRGDGRPMALSWAACLPFDAEAASNVDCEGARGMPLPDATFRPLSYLGWLTQQPGFDAASLDAADSVSGISLSAGIPLFTWLRATAGDESAVALKRVTLVKTTARNTNPMLAGIDVDGVPFGSAVSFKAGREFTFTPALAPASFEPYLDGTTGKTLTEEPVVMWYSSDGKFADLSTFPPKYPENAWRSPRLEDGEAERSVDFWFVVLDLRGGIDWREVRGVRVVP